MEVQWKKNNARVGIRYTIALFMAVVLFVMMQMFVHATAEGGTATVKAGKTDVKVRASAVNGSEVAKVNGGDTFTIVSSTEGSDGYTWYEITGEVNGSTINGYIRSDFVDVTEAAPAEGGEAAPAEGGENTEGGDAAPAETGADTTTVVSGSISPMDPPAGEDGNPQAPQLPEGFKDVKIRINQREVSAWTNDTFYIFYASSPEGNTGWYLYDSAEGRWIRYTDFLLNAASAPAAEAPAEGGVSVTIVIVMGVVIAILLIACVFLGMKAFSANRDDDDDDDDYEDDDDDDAEDDEEDQPVKKPAPQRPVQQPQGAPRQGAPRQGQPRQGAPRQGQPQGAPRQGAPRQGQPQGAPRQGAPRQGQPVRRNPQAGGAPVTRRSPQGGAQRPQQRQSRPVVDDDEE